MILLFVKRVKRTAYEMLYTNNILYVIFVFKTLFQIPALQLYFKNSTTHPDSESAI